MNEEYIKRKVLKVIDSCVNGIQLGHAESMAVLAVKLLDTQKPWASEFAVAVYYKAEKLREEGKL